MRTRTFVFSFLVHSLVLGVAMAVRLVATTELPDPPIATRFMIAAPVEVPEVPPPPPRAVQSTAPAVSQNAIPLKAPESIAPEPPGDLPEAVANGPNVIIGAPGDAVGDVIGPAPPPRRIAPAVPSAPLRPGGNVRPPQKVHHVAPTYPPIAQAARVSGTVILDALIAEDGSVRDVKVMRSVTLLDAAAIEAVRQWRFTPTLLNGVPVQVIMTVTVTFNLN
jgi:periplasmic protein TonB